jgi:hypothetical protein
VTSSPECLVLGASLGSAYRKFVVDQPELKSVLAGIKEDFRRVGRQLNWSTPYSFPLLPHNDGAILNLNWILRHAKAMEPGKDEKRAVAELNELVDDVNKQAEIHVIKLIDRFRSGEWVAHGIKEPPNHELERTIIQPDWWRRDDSIVDYSHDDIYRKVLKDTTPGQRSTSRQILDRWKHIKQFSMIVALDVFPERRVNPSSGLLDAVNALADPSDRDKLRRARAQRNQAFEDLDMRLREELFSLLLLGRLRLLRRDRLLPGQNWVGKDTLKFAELNFEDSTMTSPGIKSVEVTVYPAEIETPRTISFNRKYKRRNLRKRGQSGPRPRDDEIVSAFEDLLARSEIEPLGPKTVIYEAV